ncbi:hypothetical protein B0H13DRAFT_2438731 [Mycena leptocephala]|nr:hypothetical protein B0H13DRAFT_2438731 [Mycena leptocephala]
MAESAFDEDEDDGEDDGDMEPAPTIVRSFDARRLAIEQFVNLEAPAVLARLNLGPKTVTGSTSAARSIPVVAPKAKWTAQSTMWGEDDGGCFVFVIPSLIDNIIIFRLWSRQSYNFNCNFVYIIQQYAYLIAIKDKIFGTTALWVPSGDNKTHGGKAKGGNKYRNSRLRRGQKAFPRLVFG